MDNSPSQDSASTELKGREEIRYWQKAQQREGTLVNSWYERFFTTQFGWDRNFYRDKKVLDIGCGPRGSLEWASMTAERVGLDPLATSYRILGTDRHSMTYCNAPSEAIPFADEYFDVVSSFNSLDHVENLERSLAEINRVIAPGGYFLVLTDVNHRPTVCEPICFSWDIVEQVPRDLRLVRLMHFEKRENGMYQSLDAAVPYDHSDPTQRYGIVCAQFVKPVPPKFSRLSA